MNNTKTMDAYQNKNQHRKYVQNMFQFQSLIQNVHKWPVIELVVFSINLFNDQPVALLPDRAFFGKTVSLCVLLPEVLESPEAVAAEPGIEGVD